MKTHKKCRGIGKALNYGCGKELPIDMFGKANFKYGLGISCRCFSLWLLNSDNGKKMIEDASLKVSKPRLELEKAKEENKKNKSLGYLIQNTVNICHEYIRLRDKGKPCISCDMAWHDEFQAGHFYKAELYSSLKFDEDNINGQCKGCNLSKEGNESGYRVGLIKRYSKELLDKLDSKAILEKQNGFKWDRFKLKEIQNYYKNKLKNYESSNKRKQKKSKY